MDWEDRYRLEYNKREIDKRIKSISAIAHRYDTSILPYITDKNGNYSERKVGMFIKELLSGGKWDLDGETVENEFSKEERDFFESFFYCSIRCYANDIESRYGILEPFERCGTFQHILDKAVLTEKDMRFHSYEELIRNEYQNLIERPFYGENPDFYPLSGFFATMDHLYSMISGKGIATVDEKAFSDKGQPEWKYVPEPDMVTGDEAAEKPERQVSEETLSDYEERENRIALINKERAVAWDEYKMSFGKIDTFITHYRRYRKLYFKISKGDLYGRIESMCTDFLYREGLLPYSVDDDMVDVVIDLEKAAVRLSAGIRRRQNNE